MTQVRFSNAPTGVLKIQHKKTLSGQSGIEATLIPTADKNNPFIGRVHLPAMDVYVPKAKDLNGLLQSGSLSTVTAKQYVDDILTVAMKKYAERLQIPAQAQVDINRSGTLTIAPSLDQTQQLEKDKPLFRDKYIYHSNL